MAKKSIQLDFVISQVHKHFNTNIPFKIKGNRIHFLVDEKQRLEYIDALKSNTLFNFDNTGKKVKGSSLGGFIYLDDPSVHILFKPILYKNRGEKNENILFEKIEQYLPCVNSIVFFEKENLFNCEEISNIRRVLNISKTLEKADIVLEKNDNTEYKISIKQTLFPGWYFGSAFVCVLEEFLENIIDGKYPNLIIEYEDSTNTFKIIDTVKKKHIKSMWSEIHNEEIIKRTVFGSDKNNVDIIVSEDFTEKNFNVKHNKLFISVKNILRNLNDIRNKNLDPVLLIRTATDRKQTYNLRSLIIPRNYTLFRTNSYYKIENLQDIVNNNILKILEKLK